MKTSKFARAQARHEQVFDLVRDLANAVRRDRIINNSYTKEDATMYAMGYVESVLASTAAGLTKAAYQEFVDDLTNRIKMYKETV